MRNVKHANHILAQYTFAVHQEGLRLFRLISENACFKLVSVIFYYDSLYPSFSIFPVRSVYPMSNKNTTVGLKDLREISVHLNINKNTNH